MESKDQSLRILLLMWINFQKLVSVKMLTSKTCDILDIKNMLLCNRHCNKSSQCGNFHNVFY